MIAVLLDEEEAERRKRNRIWMKEMLRKRKNIGEYHTLYRQLEDDESCFYKYFRMSKYQFYILLQKIEIQIQKQNTTFREAISAKEKLMVCLR